MDKSSSTYVVVFATIVCVVMATGLAGTFNALKETIDGNNLFDKQRNVLIACGLYDPKKGQKTQTELEELFRAKVTGIVLEFTKAIVQEKVRFKGELVTRDKEVFASAKDAGFPVAELAKARRDNPDKILGEIYIAQDDSAGNGKKIYCIPISGYGLWSTLYGFLALEEDKSTVRGITFYKHGETPGLGGEVEQDWWKQGWVGKQTHDSDGKLVSITVLKGRGNDTRGRPHAVDGISGSTITSNGVTRFVKQDLEKYEAYFKGLDR